MDIQTFEFWVGPSGSVISFDAPEGTMVRPRAIAVTPGGGRAYILEDGQAPSTLFGGLSSDEVSILSSANRIVAAVGNQGREPTAFNLSIRYLSVN